MDWTDIRTNVGTMNEGHTDRQMLVGKTDVDGGGGLVFVAQIPGQVLVGRTGGIGRKVR